MRVTVFCEGLDVWISNIPTYGIEIAFKPYGEAGQEQFAFIDYEKAEEIAKAIKFIAKSSSGVEVPF